MNDILTRIVERRRSDNEKLGFTMGETVPDTRVRGAPIPFPAPLDAKKGVVLEIKRASPSKGEIAPNLDAAQTAAQYAAAGTTAISVLTEHHWFKGGLADLQAAAKAVDEYAKAHGTPPVAILRKDFLLSCEEIEVAYRSGADAVLLIARILSAETMVVMARTCERLGMTAFIELRENADLQKLAAVVRNVSLQTIVCGVNARDLQDFSIDLLTPASLFQTIQEIVSENTKDSSSVRIIFESGIRTPEAARFAGSLGFTGMLLGEAAARNPSEAKDLVSAFIHAPDTANAAFWRSHAQKITEKNRTPVEQTRPFVKICGITNLCDAQKAFELGADFLGFIFWEKSPRRTSEEAVRTISSALRKHATDKGISAPKLVGVIVDADSEDGKTVRRLVQEGVLDCIQLHGCAESFFALEGEAVSAGSATGTHSDNRPADIPHYAAISMATEDDISKLDALRLFGEPRILIDAHSALTPGGTGKRIADALVEKVSHKTKLWLAGGITPDNVRDICNAFHPELIDIASGTEAEPGKKDHAKLEKLFAELQ